jgi:hypothetical protein
MSIYQISSTFVPEILIVFALENDNGEEKEGKC